MMPISEKYAKAFLDDAKYEGRAERQLRGLAAVVEDTDSSWRPRLTELVSLLPPSSRGSNALLVAGAAYGCAKVIQDEFPGPAILLYGAALNAIGSSPNNELESSIAQAVEVLNDAGLLDNEQIKVLVLAAKERAQFDKVSQMLRDEFSAGMRASGLFDDEVIPNHAREIVSVTHDVRHKGLIERVQWRRKTKEIGGTDTDAGYLVEIDEIEFTDDLLRTLLRPARIGCAYAIKSRLDTRRAE